MIRKAFTGLIVYAGSDPTGATATQEFLFRAVGTGHTSLEFRETAPGSGVLASYTLTITVLPRRRMPA